RAPRRDHRRSARPGQHGRGARQRDVRAQRLQLRGPVPEGRRAVLRLERRTAGEDRLAGTVGGDRRGLSRRLLAGPRDSVRVPGRMRAQPFLALRRAHLLPLLAEALALLRRHLPGGLEDRTRALALLRVHLLEAAHAAAGAFARLRRQFLPALGTLEHARALLRVVVPAVAQRRDQQFALFGAQLFPARQFRLARGG